MRDILCKDGFSSLSRGGLTERGLCSANEAELFSPEPFSDMATVGWGGVDGIGSLASEHERHVGLNPVKD